MSIIKDRFQYEERNEKRNGEIGSKIKSICEETFTRNVFDILSRFLVSTNSIMVSSIFNLAVLNATDFQGTIIYTNLHSDYHFDPIKDLIMKGLQIKNVSPILPPFPSRGALSQSPSLERANDMLPFFGIYLGLKFSVITFTKCFDITMYFINDDPSICINELPYPTQRFYYNGISFNESVYNEFTNRRIVINKNYYFFEAITEGWVEKIRKENYNVVLIGRKPEDSTIKDYINQFRHKLIYSEILRIIYNNMDYVYYLKVFSNILTNGLNLKNMLTSYPKSFSSITFSLDLYFNNLLSSSDIENPIYYFTFEVLNINRFDKLLHKYYLIYLNKLQIKLASILNLHNVKYMEPKLVEESKLDGEKDVNVVNYMECKFKDLTFEVEDLDAIISNIKRRDHNHTSFSFSLGSMSSGHLGTTVKQTHTFPSHQPSKDPQNFERGRERGRKDECHPCIDTSSSSSSDSDSGQTKGHHKGRKKINSSKIPEPVPLPLQAKDQQEFKLNLPLRVKNIEHVQFA